MPKVEGAASCAVCGYPFPMDHAGYIWGGGVHMRCGDAVNRQTRRLEARNERLERAYTLLRDECGRYCAIGHVEQAEAILNEPQEPSYVEYRASGCHAGGDGDCDWPKCPQLRDGEPLNSGRDCPLLNESRGVG